MSGPEKPTSPHKDVLPEGAQPPLREGETVGGAKTDAGAGFASMSEVDRKGFIEHRLSQGDTPADLISRFGIPEEEASVYFSSLPGEPDQEGPTPENTHFITTEVVYTPPSGHKRLLHKPQLEDFLQSAAAYTVKRRSQKYMHITFANGPRTFEIVKKRTRGGYTLRVLEEKY